MRYCKLLYCGLFLLIFAAGNLDQFRTNGVSARAHADGVTFLTDHGQVTMSLDGPAVKRITGDRDRISLDRGRITEILDRRDEGIEHSFLIHEGEAGPFSLRVLTDTDVESAISYSKLEVYDANGKPLEAQMEFHEGAITIDVLEGGAYPILVDPLATSPAFSSLGGVANAQFGRGVATAGDVNGDGFDDVVIGAQLYNGGLGQRGRVLVYHGSASGLSPTPNFFVDGPSNDSRYGISVDSGDFNNDGFDDIVVGAQFHDNGNTNEGAAYVYAGSANGLSSTPLWTGEGGSNNAYFGREVANAGDVNNDGFDDLIVGAWYHSNGQTQEGRAYIFHGGPGGPSANPVTTIESNQASARLGVWVDGAGDVNNDGFDDVVIGAYWFDAGQTNEGNVRLHMGSATGVSTASSWTFEGNQANAFVGTCSGVGDINNDGFDDVAVGAYGYDQGGMTDRGAVFLFYGSNSGLSTAPVWTRYGDSASAFFGYKVEAAGDVNGDGIDDLCVGSHGYDSQLTNVGRAYVFHGSPTGPSNTADWILEGTQADAQTGVSVAFAGDVNGDNGDDLIVGAHAQDGTAGINEGYAAVFYGTPGAPPAGSAGGGGIVPNNRDNDNGDGNPFETICSAGTGSFPIAGLFLVLLLGVAWIRIR